MGSVFLLRARLLIASRQRWRAADCRNTWKLVAASSRRRNRREIPVACPLFPSELCHHPIGHRPKVGFRGPLSMYASFLFFIYSRDHVQAVLLASALVFCPTIFVQADHTGRIPCTHPPPYAKGPGIHEIPSLPRLLLPPPAPTLFHSNMALRQVELN